MNANSRFNQGFLIPPSIFEMTKQSKVVTLISIDANTMSVVKDFFYPQIINQQSPRQNTNKTQTVVVLDFESLSPNAPAYHSLINSSQDRFDLVQKNLEQNVVGLIVLVSGKSAKMLAKAKHLLEFISSQGQMPFLVGVTDCESQSAWQPIDVADYFELSQSQVNAFSVANTKHSLKTMIQRLEQQAICDSRLLS